MKNEFTLQLARAAATCLLMEVPWEQLAVREGKKVGISKISGGKEKEDDLYFIRACFFCQREIGASFFLECILERLDEKEYMMIAVGIAACFQQS